MVKKKLDYNSLSALKIILACRNPEDQYNIKEILDSWYCDATLIDVEKSGEIAGFQTADLIIINSSSMMTESFVTLKTHIYNIIIVAENKKEAQEMGVFTGNMAAIYKPVSSEKLFKAINKIIVPVFKRTDSITANEAAFLLPISDERLFDLSLLQSIGKDDNEFAKKIIATFVELMPGSLSEIKTAAINNDIDQVRKLAHKMKSSADLLGISSLKKTLLALEKISAGENTEIHIATLETTLNKVFIQLRNPFEESTHA
jgi:HPt (histidine-containing phosphotransfer) domain-containing protein